MVVFTWSQLYRNGVNLASLLRADNFPRPPTKSERPVEVA